MYRAFLLLLLELSLSSCDVAIPRNSKISLHCLTDNDSSLVNVKFTWSFNSTPILSKDKIGRDGKVLHLTDIKFSDEGEYKCVLEGLKGENYVRLRRTFKIRVEVPPPLQELKIIKSTVGDNVRLPCQVQKSSYSETNETAPAVWKREIKGETVLLNPKKGINQEEENMTTNRVFWDDKPEERDWTIKISQVTKEDAGTYLCVINTSETLLVDLEVEGVDDSNEVFCALLNTAAKVPCHDKPRPLPRCHKHTHPWETCEDPDNRSWKSTLKESLTEFSFSVYFHLKGSKPSTNFIFSPISIAAALSNLLLGARGETRKQLQDALRLPYDFSCVHSEMKKLKQASKQTLGMASAIFYSPEYRLAEAFINQSLDFYDAKPQELTNDSDHNVKLINNWVAEKTNNKITELVDEVDPFTLFVLLNAVYFNGKWKMVFESMNKQEEFTKFSGEVVDVETLYSSKYKLVMSYNKNLKAEVGKFPLTGKNSLFILIPRTVSEKSFLLMEKNMNATNIIEMVSEMSKVTAQTAEVTLPKIKLAVTTPLETLLKKLGLSDLFDSPNLCGMFPGESVSFISDARHRAFLSLTEKGVEAAAATSISFSRSFPSFTALQPFILIVWSDEIGAPLFIGRIVNPL
ncbi:plasma protease C1 inhibitor-like isoform X2 [Myxocyprinus asiaticus]|uniref:plasma protease C1 inhibitor-like isoform X2 n=1 Tax=Myxocyprinus asiaticus TaxID=70543 RepID=UPI0022237B02|nr:plasma protease C1 inhibitor-like isoform X2 [Myxocyprinus asiaticus]